MELNRDIFLESIVIKNYNSPTGCTLVSESSAVIQISPADPQLQFLQFVPENSIQTLFLWHPNKILAGHSSLQIVVLETARKDYL